MEEKPRYEHDCDACTFLGCHEDKDLYFCPQDLYFGRDYGEPTLIVRYSDDALDYSSCPDTLVPVYFHASETEDTAMTRCCEGIIDTPTRATDAVFADLNEAYNRAKARGLV